MHIVTLWFSRFGLLSLCLLGCAAALAGNAPRSVPPPKPLWMTAPELVEYNERGKQAAKRIMTASRAEQEDPNAFDLAKLDTQEAIQHRRERLREYREAWQELSELTRNREEKLRDELERLRVTAERTAEILESYRRNQAMLDKVRAQTPDAPPLETYFELVGDLLDLAEKNRGAWRLDSGGRVVIIKEEFGRRYRAWRERVRAYVEAGESMAAAVEARAKEARERLKARQAGSDFAATAGTDEALGDERTSRSNATER